MCSVICVRNGEIPYISISNKCMNLYIWNKHYLIRNTTTIILIYVFWIVYYTRGIIYDVCWSQRDRRAAVNRTWAHAYARFASNQFEWDIHPFESTKSVLHTLTYGVPTRRLFFVVMNNSCPILISPFTHSWRNFQKSC